MTYQEESTIILITEAGIKPTGKDKFEGKIFNSSNFKIYILKHGNDYLYVGKTKQKIGTKFQQGFRSYKYDLANNRQAGYGGYKWIKKFINTQVSLQLFVYDFETIKEENHIEAVEAEIAYAIRKSTNKWPLWQNEIHFYNDFENFKDAKNVANELFEKTKANIKTS